jgi:cell division ATPase FtsA
MPAFSSRKKWQIFIDIAHSSCRSVAISPDLTEIRFHEVPSSGLSKGKILSPNNVIETLKKLISLADLENLTSTVVVNLPANHTRTITQTIKSRLNGAYSSRDYDGIIEGAFDSALGGLDEVIDVLPIQIKIDGNSIDPLRFSTPGNEVSARLLLATHPSVLLSDILNCINAAGIEVSEFRSNAFGCARALTYLRSGAENSVLLDFGHSTITGSLMVGGVLNQVFCVPAGSLHITKDLAAGFGVETEEAERLKITWGVNLGTETSGHQAKLNHFARPRVSELLSLSCKYFSIYRKSLDGGLLLCGGGSALAGLCDMATEKLGVRPPFLAKLDNAGAYRFVGLTPRCENLGPTAGGATIDSSWIAILAQARSQTLYGQACREEKASRPLSRLNPLWTWLSELSR